MKGDFRVDFAREKIFKFAVDTYAQVVHIHIYDVERTRHGDGGKLRVLQPAPGDEIGDAVL